ncbi:MAG TPA: PEP-CTERM sorting domain-containing protein [Phycisphaerae bacterium]|nr:PEP-CTERM sorting domain-containing protein [Phycisphaerae bacterium]
MKAYIVLLVAGSLLLVTSAAQGVTADQVDDFEIGGDTANWTGGNPIFSPAPSQVPDGGPGGLGDGYLQIGVSGFHLGIRNIAGQWAGDYLAAGITAVEMDVNRIAGPSDVSLRILLFGPGGTWASTDLAPTLTGPGWQHLSFGLSAADLTYVPGSTNPQAPDGTGILGDTLSGVTRLLIRHDSVTPTIPGLSPPFITATLGIDNITAVPEPSLLGDANNDGVVSADDYGSVQLHFGDTGDIGILGDANLDGVVSADDYGSVQLNFGATQGMPTPEPATLALLVLGGLVMLRRKRK